MVAEELADKSTTQTQTHLFILSPRDRNVGYPASGYYDRPNTHIYTGKANAQVASLKTTTNQIKLMC